jgi:hypothetical protein
MNKDKRHTASVATIIAADSLAKSAPPPPPSAAYTNEPVAPADSAYGPNEAPASETGA